MRLWPYLLIVAAAISCDEKRQSHAPAEQEHALAAPKGSQIRAACDAPTFAGAQGRFPELFQKEPRDRSWATATEEALAQTLDDLDPRVTCRCRHCRVVGHCRNVAECQTWALRLQQRRDELRGIDGLMLSSKPPPEHAGGGFVHAYLRYP